MLIVVIRKYNPTRTNPYIPKKLAPNIKISLYHLNEFISSGSEKANDDMDVMATTIIIIGDTIPADTAASPNIRAPTMDRELLAKLGIFKSLSLNISKENIISIASIKAEKGTFSLCPAILSRSGVGIIS